MINTWHLVPIVRSRNLNTSAHCMVVLECARGTQYSQSLDITMLFLRGETEQEQLLQWAMVRHDQQFSFGSNTGS